MEGEEARGGHGHTEKHARGGGGAYEKAVEQKTGHGDRGEQDGVEEIAFGGLAHGDGVGEEGDERAAAEGKDGGEQERKTRAPSEERADEAAETRCAAGTDEVTAHGFAGVGETVHDVAHEGEELEQYSVGRKEGGAAPTAEGREREHDGDETEGAEKDEDVDREERTPRAGIAEGGGEPRCAAVSPQGAEGEKEGEGGADPLREEGAAGDAHEPEPEAVNEEQAGADVEEVLHHGDEEGRARVLPTEQPAVEDVETQGGGGTPNEYAVVSDGLRGHGGGGGHERETEMQQGRL